MNSLLSDLAYGRITVASGFVPTMDEIVEITVEAIEEEYHRYMSLNGTVRRTAGINLIRYIDRFCQDQSPVMFKPDGRHWLDDVKILVSKDLFALGPKDLGLTRPAPSPYDDDPTQYHQHY